MFVANPKARRRRRVVSRGSWVAGRRSPVGGCGETWALRYWGLDEGAAVWLGSCAGSWRYGGLASLVALRAGSPSPGS